MYKLGYMVWKVRRSLVSIWTHFGLDLLELPGLGNCLWPALISVCWMPQMVATLPSLSFEAGFGSCGDILVTVLERSIGFIDCWIYLQRGDLEMGPFTWYWNLPKSLGFLGILLKRGGFGPPPSAENDCWPSLTFLRLLFLMLGSSVLQPCSLRVRDSAVALFLSREKKDVAA